MPAGYYSHCSMTSIQLGKTQDVKCKVQTAGTDLEDTAAELVKVGTDAQLKIGGGHAAPGDPLPQHREQPRIRPGEIEHRC